MDVSSDQLCWLPHSDSGQHDILTGYATVEVLHQVQFTPLVLQQGGAVLYPVAIVIIGDIAILPNYRVVQVTTDNAVDLILPGQVSGGLLITLYGLSRLANP